MHNVTTILFIHHELHCRENATVLTQKRTALTIPSQKFLIEVIEILWCFQHACHLMEVEVRHKDIFGISCYVDYLKEVQSEFQQHMTLAVYWGLSGF